MDNFEKNIRQRASEFDVYKADKTKMWSHISKELALNTPKVTPFYRSRKMAIAATLLLLLGLASIISMQIWGSTTTEVQYASKELIDIDMHYKGLVSYQVQLVQQHKNLSEADKVEFLSFIDELDVEYNQLRSELQTNLDNEQVLEAIVSNYKKRIELIENLLKQINDSKLTDNDYGYTL